MKKAKRIKSIIVKLSQLPLFIKIKVWIVEYNTDFPHSSLNYKIPEHAITSWLPPTHFSKKMNGYLCPVFTETNFAGTASNS